MPGYYKEITVPTSSVTGGPHGLIPVTVDLGSDADIAANVAFADGRDIHFTTTGGAALPHVFYSSGDFLTADGIRTWFNGSQGIYSATYGKSWWGAIGNTQHTKIIEVDHTAKTAQEYSLSTSQVQLDDHDDPGVLCLDAAGPNGGKLLAAWSYHNGNSWWRVSTNAGDASAWGSVNATGATVDSYVQLAQFGAADNYEVWWFFRRYSGTPPFYPHYVRISDDGGATFDTPIELIRSASNRPYVRIAKNGADRVDVFFTDGGIGEATTNSLYHFYIEGGSCYQSDGTLIRTMASVAGGSPILPADATVVYDATSADDALIYDAAAISGSPVCAFEVYATGNRQYWQGRLVAGSWVTQQITDANGEGLYVGAESYSPGIALDPDDADSVLVGRYVSGIAEMQRYGLTSGTFGSATWTKTEDVTENSEEDNFRPWILRDAAGTVARESWCGNGPYTDYTAFHTGLRCNPAIVPRYNKAVVGVTGLSDSAPTTFRVKYGDPAQVDTQDAAGVYPNDLINMPGFIPVNGVVGDIALIGGTGTIQSRKPSGNYITSPLGVGFYHNTQYTANGPGRASVTGLDLAGKSAFSAIIFFRSNRTGAANAEHTLFSSSYVSSTVNANFWIRIEPTTGAIEAFLITNGGFIDVSPTTGSLVVAANTDYMLCVSFAQSGGGWTISYRLNKSKGGDTDANTTTMHSGASQSPLVIGAQQDNTGTADKLLGAWSNARVVDSTITDNESDTYYDLRDGSTLTFGAETEDTVSPIEGTASVTLDDVTGASAGVSPIEGQSTSTLDDVVGTGAAELLATGSASVTLDDVTGTATAGSGTTGTASQTLDDVVGAGTAVSPITAGGSVTLDDVTGEATGTGLTVTTGEGSVTLDDVTGQSAAESRIAGLAAAALDDVIGLGEAIALIQAAAAITLDDVTGTATGGDPGAVIVPDDSRIWHAPKRQTVWRA